MFVLQRLGGIESVRSNVVPIESSFDRSKGFDRPDLHRISRD